MQEQLETESPQDSDSTSPQYSDSTPNKKDGRKNRIVWLGLVGVYLLLLVSTGFLAFLDAGEVAGYELRGALAAIDDEETKTFVLDGLRQEGEEHSKRQDLATQSFNVVLGALLGFLSASTTSLFKRPGRSQDAQEL